MCSNHKAPCCSLGDCKASGEVHFQLCCWRDPPLEIGTFFCRARSYLGVQVSRLSFLLWCACTQEGLIRKKAISSLVNNGFTCCHFRCIWAKRSLAFVDSFAIRYCSRRGWTKFTNDATHNSRSGRIPNSVQKKIKCLKQQFRCDIISKASSWSENEV